MKIIYAVKNVINKKFYIGQTTISFNKRKWLHLFSAKNGVNTVFYKAIRKYGVENFKWLIIDICSTNKELNLKEIYYIKYYNTLIPNGYNMSEGGENRSGKNNPMYGKHQSDKCKIINRYRRLGSNMSLSIKKKIGISLKGRKCSEYSKQVNSKRIKGIKNIAIKYYSYILTPNNVIEKVKCLKIWCISKKLNYNSFRNALSKWGYSKGYKLIKRERI